MKHRLIQTLIILSISLCTQAQRINLDSLYDCLDKEITKSEKYINQRDQRIDKIKAKLAKTSAILDRHRLSWNLFKEYQAYMNDSAIHYLNYCIDIASKNKQSKLLVNDYIALTHQYAATGFYNEALEYLKYINGNKLKGQQLIDYYACCNHLYGEMGCYSKDSKLKDRCYRLSGIFRDSLYKKASPNSNIYLWRKVAELTTDNKYSEAMKECDKWMKQVKPNTHDYANMAFFRSEIYKGMHNIELCKYWLAISAICDIRNAVMDQASLWSLANMLSREGNLERSNRYVEYSWNCTQRYNTHLRSWLISPVLGVISDTYKTNLRKANYQLKSLIGAVSLLSVFLLASYIYVCHKKRQLSRARNELKTINMKLESLNSKLSGKNEELSSLNTKLSETNRLKDEYIGKFLSACSEYIDKIDNYRIKINRKLKANQMSDLMKMTSSDQLKQDEIKELFDNFDSVFLNIFPNFVVDFNLLLQPQHRIIPPSKTQLTTDLRIFALIRLGIEESSRIAEFLRYSPNSIYNYRARIKSKALCNRDEFEHKVKEIGMDM
ncbi:transcriptional regulator [Prevotella herbatica]|uniref:Transcriptional regulator n=1 Tax=Prevotella herbatica TaxID=2801997 RepID=A0ABM7NY31_9BACT|nr:DUF6377 domain-containing protein [Prevotella herbatica]BCS85382.1 transcriptional regulator [Prevotella herbatica]